MHVTAVSIPHDPVTLTGIIIAMVLLAVAIIIIGEFLKDFMGEKGSTFDRLLAAGKGSITILWARFCAFVAAVTGSLMTIADYFNAPGVSDAIAKVMQPQYMAILGLAIAILTEVARRRTLDPPSK